MSPARKLMCVGVVLAFAVVGPTRAGEDVPLSAILPQFFVDGVQTVNAGHTAHFKDQAGALAIMAQIDATLATQFATYPLTSSSGAFTVTLDPETGQPVPTSESFGPIFAERPETLGKGKANLGITSLSYHFDRLEGFDLNDGGAGFTLLHEDEDRNGNRLTHYYEGDIIDSTLLLDLKLNTTISFANFGVTDRFDLGLAVPYVKAKLEATTRDTIIPLATSGDASPKHEFAGGALTADFTRRGQKSGLGDVVLRGKYNFKKGFAGAFDLRLPTGDEKNLLGSGATQLRLLLIARGPKYNVFYGGLYPHLNLGYTISKGDYTIPIDDLQNRKLTVEPSDEINYTVGFDAALGARVTFAFDLLGRILLNTQRLNLREETLIYNTAGNDTDPIQIGTITRPEIVSTKQDLSLLVGTAGVKINIAKGLLVNISGLVPILRDRGLETDFTASLGLDYTF